MWHAAALEIQAALRNDSALTNLVRPESITVGMPLAKPTADKYPVIWIVKGDLENVVYKSGLIDFLWTFDICVAVREDKIDVSYETLGEIEEAMFKKLAFYSGETGILWIKPRGCVSDRDTFRPFLGGWWTIEVNYRWRPA